ncbi:MAG: enoyl-CoA hydratase-related protein [Actinomycetota bacterium]|nr:enoyl-CoA hydratase-related protein [Actinomycetota bacterium]MDA2971749.1 enoyl-CoA hydratase-related protein [Actinomycetota bacterium]MDA3000596.1 enoyl-CoA hydratase-related protein [Actinomycetota bacterium]
MSGQTILYEVIDGVAIITLNRPDVRNAFGAGMGDELSAAYRRADLDDHVRVVVLTGTPPAFCAGADLSSGGDTFRPRDEQGFSASGVSMRPWDVRKPVIAAVNGHAIGIGFTLALQCDIRIFARDAKYGIVQARRGMMGDGMSHWTLPRIAGFANAADVLLTGRMFDGDEATRMGICSRVVDNDQVLPTALEVARDISINVSPASAAASKRALWQTWTSTPDDIERLETELHHVLMRLPDAKEGVEAFLERREPRWTTRVTDVIE